MAGEATVGITRKSSGLTKAHLGLIHLLADIAVRDFLAEQGAEADEAMQLTEAMDEAGGHA